MTLPPETERKLRAEMMTVGLTSEQREHVIGFITCIVARPEYERGWDDCVRAGNIQVRFPRRALKPEVG